MVPPLNHSGIPA